jgi:hypothetical protein
MSAVPSADFFSDEIEAKSPKFHIFRSMKWLSIILSIYYMLLSTMPCTDAQECHESNQTIISSLNDHGDHSHEAELCSPFCPCLCCGQFVSFDVNEVALDRIVPPPSRAHGIFKSGFSLDVHLAIWQPPKIS